MDHAKPAAYAHRMVDAPHLAAPLAEGDVGLELLGERHLEGLRAACAEDQEIWEIFPHSMLGEHFDTVIAARERFHATRDWVNYAILSAGEVVGMTSFIAPDAANKLVEIGGTYIAPRMRGGRFNATVKRLMIEHALACGFTRIEFRIDTRNTRSMRAVEKLGATLEGVLRKNRITWTGYVRDTAVYGLLADEWRS